MKILKQILLLSLFGGASCLSAQGEFYTINHDTKVMLKSSKKNDPLKKYYDNQELEDILIFRNGLDRPIKLAGNLDLISNNIDFEISGLKHSIPLDNIDSVYVGIIPKKLENMIVEKFINANILARNSDFYVQRLIDGDVKLFKRTKVKVRRANYNRALAIGNKEDTYIVRGEYFILTENNKFEKIPKKNKSLLKLIASYKGATTFFEKRELDSEKEEDLKLLITYINKK